MYLHLFNYFCISMYRILVTPFIHLQISYILYLFFFTRFLFWFNRWHICNGFLRDSWWSWCIHWYIYLNKNVLFCSFISIEMRRLVYLSHIQIQAVWIMSHGDVRKNIQRCILNKYFRRNVAFLIVLFKVIMCFYPQTFLFNLNVSVEPGCITNIYFDKTATNNYTSYK